MGEKIPKLWIVVIIVLVLLLVAVFAGKSFLERKDDLARFALSLEEKTRELEKRERQIQDLDSQIARLRKELEERSKRETELQTKLDEASKALSSAQQKLKSATRLAERPPTPQPQPKDRIATKPPEPAPPPVSRRSAEQGSYEVVRTTSVHEEPSAFSRKVSTIEKGTIVTVVGSVGEWLEVRSKFGNPPGFIRRDDAMFMGRKN